MRLRLLVMAMRCTCGDGSTPYSGASSMARLLHCPALVWALAGRSTHPSAGQLPLVELAYRKGPPGQVKTST